MPRLDCGQGLGEVPLSWNPPGGHGNQFHEIRCALEDHTAARHLLGSLGIFGEVISSLLVVDHAVRERREPSILSPTPPPGWAGWVMEHLSGTP